MSTLGPVKIQAVTWNMGSQTASENAVNDIFSQILPGKTLAERIASSASLPDVITVSTQEEYAKFNKDKNGKELLNDPSAERLVDKLLVKLNGSVKPPPYKIAYVESHHTSAGFKLEKPSSQKSLHDQHRVRLAVIVRTEFDLEEVSAHIDFQDNIGKQKKEQKQEGNKSIITIKGTLTKNGEKVMDVQFSGCHMDPNKDSKRRDHTDLFLESSGLKSEERKSFDTIYNEASTFRMISGDFNERNQLYGVTNGSEKRSNVYRDRMQQSNLGLHGFKFAEKPKMLKTTPQGGEEMLAGTYGCRGVAILNPKEKRKHVAIGGHLDRVAVNTGLSVTPTSYGYTANDSYYDDKSEKKITYHGSDHIPVIGKYNVATPADTTEARFELVKNYVGDRLPAIDVDHSESIIKLHSLAIRSPSPTLTELRGKFNSLPIRHVDSEYEVDEYMKIFVNVPNIPNQSMSDIAKAIIEGIKTKHQQMEDIKNNYTELQNKVSALRDSPQNRHFLENVHLLSNQYQELRNQLEILKELPLKENFTKEDKANLIRQTQAWLDLSYLNALKVLNGKNPEINDDNQLVDILKQHQKIEPIQKFLQLKMPYDKTQKNVQPAISTGNVAKMKDAQQTRPRILAHNSHNPLNIQTTNSAVKISTSAQSKGWAPPDVGNQENHFIQLKNQAIVNVLQQRLDELKNPKQTTILGINIKDTNAENNRKDALEKIINHIKADPHYFDNNQFSNENKIDFKQVLIDVAAKLKGSELENFKQGIDIKSSGASFPGVEKKPSKFKEMADKIENISGTTTVQDMYKVAKEDPHSSQKAKR